MKKHFLMLSVLSVSAALQASPINPVDLYGAAPTAPTSTGGSTGGGLFGSGGLFGGAGGAAGALGSAATGIPPIQAGVGIGVATTTQKANTSQNIKVSGGDNTQAAINAGQTVYQSAQTTASASGMGK